jgi:hypothetical protein
MDLLIPSSAETLTGSRNFLVTVVFVVAFCSPTMDQVSTYFEHRRGRKVARRRGWLISTILLKFNHLRGMIIAAVKCA